jgi:molybdopterin/thiamine biosynthesis adenylyltransferase
VSDEELQRYSRHLLLDEIGIEGQQRLQSAHALIVGAGGLGSPVALYLGSSGVGHITLVDDDLVELTNLQRQIAHGMASLGLAKVDSAARAIRALNPLVRVSAIQARADAAWLAQAVASADVVIDCCDNYATRHAVNVACVAQRKPLVSGAAVRFDGQLAVFDLREADSACYACVFPPQAQHEEVACASLGVLAPLVGIIGSMQAAEAIKLLAGMESGLSGRLQMLDARRMEWTEVRFRRQAHCPVCA